MNSGNGIVEIMGWAIPGRVIMFVGGGCAYQWLCLVVAMPSSGCVDSNHIQQHIHTASLFWISSYFPHA